MSTLVLPWPVSVNELYRSNRSGKSKRLSEAGKRYQHMICIYLRGCKKIEGHIQAKMYLFPKTNRKIDTSNFSKCLWDAISISGYWGDDSQIKEETYIMGAKSSTPCAVVFTEPLTTNRPTLQETIGRDLTTTEKKQFNEWYSTQGLLRKL